MFVFVLVLLTLVLLRGGREVVFGVMVVVVVETLL